MALESSEKSREAEIRLLKYEAEFFKSCNLVRQNGVELHQLKSYLLSELLELERNKGSKMREYAQSTIGELQASKEQLDKELDHLRRQVKIFQLSSFSDSKGTRHKSTQKPKTSEQSLPKPLKTSHPLTVELKENSRLTSPVHASNHAVSQVPDIKDTQRDTTEYVALSVEETGTSTSSDKDLKQEKTKRKPGRPRKNKLLPSQIDTKVTNATPLDDNPLTDNKVHLTKVVRKNGKSKSNQEPNAATGKTDKVLPKNSHHTLGSKKGKESQASKSKHRKRKATLETDLNTIPDPLLQSSTEPQDRDKTAIRLGDDSVKVLETDSIEEASHIDIKVGHKKQGRSRKTKPSSTTTALATQEDNDKDKLKVKDTNSAIEAVHTNNTRNPRVEEVELDLASKKPVLQSPRRGRPKKIRLTDPGLQSPKRGRGRPRKVRPFDSESPSQVVRPLLPPISSSDEIKTHQVSSPSDNGNAASNHPSTNKEIVHQQMSNVEGPKKVRKRGRPRKQKSTTTVQQTTINDTALQRSTEIKDKISSDKEVHSVASVEHSTDDPDLDYLKYVYDPSVSIGTRTRSRLSLGSGSTGEDEPPRKKAKRTEKRKKQPAKRSKKTVRKERTYTSSTDSDHATHTKQRGHQHSDYDSYEQAEQIPVPDLHTDIREPSLEIPLQNTTTESVPPQLHVSTDSDMQLNSSGGEPHIFIPHEEPARNGVSTESTVGDDVSSQGNSIIALSIPNGETDIPSSISKESEKINGHSTSEDTVTNGHTVTDESQSTLELGNTDSLKHGSIAKTTEGSVVVKDRNTEPNSTLPAHSLNVTKKNDKFRHPKALKKPPRQDTDSLSNGSLGDSSVLPALKKRKTLFGSKSRNASAFQLSIVDNEELPNRKTAIRVNTKGLKTLKLKTRDS